ncbi:hypothetical protein [Chitinophaga caeni]|nr:hypothetical protein [Chitinophaga caeni]
MRNKLILGCLVGLLAACQPAVKPEQKVMLPDSMVMVPSDTMIVATDTTLTPVMVESWKHLQSLNGKYAHEIGLLQKEPLKKRLSVLLSKKELQDFQDRYKVTPPIEIQEGVLFNDGCKPHNCMEDEAAIAIDMKKDIIYIGIARHKNVSIYSEKSDTIYPGKLKQWMKKFMEPGALTK